MSVENRNLENNLDTGIESSLYILETDTAIKDSLLEGEFTDVLNSRVSYFKDLIAEKTGALKEFLEQFVGMHASLASENLNLDSLKESGLDVLTLSDLIHNLFIAQQSYLKYLIDLEFYLLTNYPELEERINVLGEYARTLVSADFFGDNLRTLYPNVNNFINSNYESFLTPSDLVLLEQSVSRVARIDLQVALDFQIETRVENILSNAFEAINNVGDYPLDPYFNGYPSFSELTYEDFLNSDLGQDLKSMIEAQLSNGYSCEPIVSSMDLAAKDTRTPYKMYTLSLRVFNDIESKDVVIDTTNYYHPYFHGRTNDDSLIPFKRMSDVNINTGIEFTDVPEWNGDILNVSLPDWGRVASSLPSDEVEKKKADKAFWYLYSIMEPYCDLSFMGPEILLASYSLKQRDYGRRPRTLPSYSDTEINSALRTLMVSGEGAREYALAAKSILDKRFLYKDVFDLMDGTHTYESIKSEFDRVYENLGFGTEDVQNNDVNRDVSQNSVSADESNSEVISNVDEISDSERELEPNSEVDDALDEDSVDGGYEDDDSDYDSEDSDVDGLDDGYEEDLEVSDDNYDNLGEE